MFCWLILLECGLCCGFYPKFLTRVFLKFNMFILYFHQTQCSGLIITIIDFCGSEVVRKPHVI